MAMFVVKYTVKSAYKELIRTMNLFLITGVPYKSVVN